jgi:hypothetical protein
VSIKQRQEDEFHRTRAFERCRLLFRFFFFFFALSMTTTTTTVENALGNPSRVHGRGLKVFPFLNLSGFGEANERVVFQASVEVFVRRSLSMRRHFNACVRV